MQTSYITNNLQGSLPTLRDGSVNLSNFYDIYTEGIYEVIRGSVNPPDKLRFNDLYPASSSNDGKIVIVVNKANDNAGDDYISTDLTDYPIIPKGEVWKFVSDGVAWRKVPTVGAVYTRANVSGTITLSKAGFYTTTGKPSITLPNASECDGQTTIIFNAEDGGSGCYVYGGIYDLENNFNNVFAMPNYSMLKLKSVGGNWRIVKYSEA